MKTRIPWPVKLLLRECELYRVKKGQTLNDVANTFFCPVSVLVRENALTSEISEGEVLRIPSERGNLYTVRGGESKTLLCGSDEAFYEKNGTHCLYPTQKVFL